MLAALLRHGVYPCVPAKGSVGASGDLTPLAHLSAILIGVGEATHRGRRMPAVEALAAAGLAPIALAPKEGLALINGTQVSTALALAGLFAAEDVFAAAIVAGALVVEAARGEQRPLRRAHPRRPRPPGADRRRRRVPLRCSTEAASWPSTRTATACRTPTRSAASRR